MLEQGNGDGKGGNKITQREIKYNDPKRGICLGWVYTQISTYGRQRKRIIKK